MAPAIDLVTLDNFEAKLPKWSPNDVSHLHALVDMGSNGIRFTISDLTPPYTRLLRCVYRERAGISLFDALQEDTSGQLALPSETITQVAQTLARFRRIALDYGVTPDHLCVFATEAMRRAANADVLLDAIATAAPGLAVYVLAPAVETLFGSMGARAGFAAIHGGLMLDLGGGSVQISYVDSRLGHGHETAAAAAGQSMPYGAARLTRMAQETAASVSIDAVDAANPHLVDDLAAALARLQMQFPALVSVSDIDIYLCGGGFRGYGSMLMHNDSVQPYPIPLIGGYRVSGAFFGETRRMHRVNHAESGKIFGLSRRRRHQFGAISAVVDALVAALARARLSVRTATFCAGGNREGALLMRLPVAVREEDPVAVLAKQDFDGLSVSHIVDSLSSALPPSPHALDDLRHLLPLVAGRIWERSGADTTANASFALHDAVDRDPGAPGLQPHRMRAFVAVALWARWGGSAAPADASLLEGLRRILREDGKATEDAVFWAEYVGGVAAVLALLYPARPQGQLDIRFQPSLGSTPSGKKPQVRLNIGVEGERMMGLDAAAVEECFGIVGKQHKKVMKLAVSVDVC